MKTVVWIVLLVAGTALFASAGTDQVLYTFTGGNDGRYPQGSVIFDSAGNVYGTTTGNGVQGGFCAGGCGTVFELTPSTDGWQEKTLHGFCALQPCIDGANPVAGLVFDSNGNLYGTTQNGGLHDLGVVFELSQSNGDWKYTVLHSFAGNSLKDGAHPYSGVTLDTKGNVFGTTLNGGESGGSGLGVVYEVKRANGKWGETVLHAFSTKGAYPDSAITLDASGNLYGTTNEGGYYRYGTVFELSRSKTGRWKEATLHSFGGGNDGIYPGAGVIFDKANNLYGTTTEGGGTNSLGVAFRLAHSKRGWSETVLHRFKGINYGDGSGPYSGLILVGDNLYGTTVYGGGNNQNCVGIHGCGTVFELARSKGVWRETILYEFSGGGDGSEPWAVPTPDGMGNLFGTTVLGGANSFGVVFLTKMVDR
jgi:uncharacterized repeat protein (TIGR03803 family)